MYTLPISTYNGIPIWRQPNDTDVGGSIWASFGLDTSSNEGRLRISPRFILNTSTADVAEITAYPCSFTYVGTHVFAFAGVSNVGYAFTNDGTMIGAFTKDVSSGAPAKIDSKKSDSVFSNNSMYVTAQESASTAVVNLFKKTGNGAWSEVVTTMTSDPTYTNMLCSYAGRTYFTNRQSQIWSMNAADTIVTSGAFTLTIGVVGDFTNVITKLLPSDDRMFILTVNTTGGKGNIYEWDGQNATKADMQHRLEASGALSGVVMNGVPYVLDSDANLLRWNGGTFVKVAQFNRQNSLPLYNPISLVNDRFIHPNGMTIVDGKIQMLIDNRNYDNGSTIEETIPAGVYEFDPELPSKGIIHLGSVGMTKAADTIIDYGQVRIAGAGALKSMGLQSTASGANGRVFVGASYYTDATTVKSGIWYDDRNDTLQKGGYVVSPKLQAQGEKGTAAMFDAWNSVYTFFRKQLSVNDKIMIKYRVTEVAPIEATITWTSTTTFTTTTDVSAYVGYEVEVIQGIGSGKSSKILSVTGSGTYTVTTSETFTSASNQTGKARFQFWIQKDSISNQLKTVNKTVISDVASWFQVKICMIFAGKDEIEKLVIVNSVNTKAE